MLGSWLGLITPLPHGSGRRSNRSGFKIKFVGRISNTHDVFKEGHKRMEESRTTTYFCWGASDVSGTRDTPGAATHSRKVKGSIFAKCGCL